MRRRLEEVFGQYNALHSEDDTVETVEVPALHDMVFWEDEVKVNTLRDKVYIQSTVVLFQPPLLRLASWLTLVTL